MMKAADVKAGRSLIVAGLAVLVLSGSLVSLSLIHI